MFYQHINKVIIIGLIFGAVAIFHSAEPTKTKIVRGASVTREICNASYWPVVVVA